MNNERQARYWRNYRKSARRESWHRDYAAESIKRAEVDPWRKDPDYYWTQVAVAGCEQVWPLCRAQIWELEKQGITVLPDDYPTMLLEKYGSARGIAAAAWGLTDEEIDNADID